MKPGEIELPIQAASTKIGSYLWIMFVVCFLGNVLAGTASTLMSVYLPVVVSDLLGQVESQRLSEVSAYINALYFIGWAIGGLIWGFIADRIGRARSLALAVCMFGLFTMLKGVAPSWESILFFQFFCGFGVGGVLVVNTTLLSEIWPEQTKSVFIGILSIGFPIGIFSSGAVNYFVSGWRQGFMVGVLPLALGIASFWILRESENWKSSRNRVGSNQGNWAANRGNLLKGSVIFGSMLVGLWATFSWMPTWVQSILISSDGQQERSLTMMLLGIGGLSGGFVSGWISNRLGVRRTMLLCFIGCFVMAFALFKATIVFTTTTLVEIAVLSFLFGISQGSLSVYIPLLFPIPIRASATGFCFNVGRFFTAAAVLFVGVLVTLLGGYGNSLFTFSFVFLLGLIFLIFQKSKN